MGKNLTVFFTGLFLALGIAAAGGAVCYGLIAGKQANRTVSVRGLAEREVDADLAVWPLKFTVAADDLTSLNEAVKRDSAIVEAYLAKNNVGKADIVKQSINVDDEAQRMYANSTPRPYRYIGEVTFLIRSVNIEAVKAADRNLRDLIAQGVLLSNNYGASQAQFLFNGLNDIKPDMIAEATVNARAAADQFAKDSGSRVGRIKTATQGLFSITDVNEAMPEKKIVRVVNTVEYFLTD